MKIDSTRVAFARNTVIRALRKGTIFHINDIVTVVVEEIIVGVVVVMS